MSEAVRRRPMAGLGKVLLIANPAAQNGAGARLACRAERLLSDRLASDALEVVYTERPGHAVELVQAAEGFDTVIALGGDGLIHEVANGAMKLPRERRPMLGLLPAGSGNDYARTLGMPKGIDEAVKALFDGEPRVMDVGCCNGEYFVQTLSFGLDAAIALDTMERRVRTGRKGALLYLASGVDQLFNHLDVFAYDLEAEAASADGSLSRIASSDRSFLFAVQVGKTYGGGFSICPEARTDDGLLDVCIAHPPIGIPLALVIFLLAKNGRHTWFKKLQFMRVESLELHFSKRPPVQIDGEPHIADSYSVRCLPRELTVLSVPTD